jgi:hypothetical protein
MRRDQKNLAPYTGSETLIKALQLFEGAKIAIPVSKKGIYQEL